MISEIIRREDKKFLNGKIKDFNGALNTMTLDILYQRNIESNHMGKKGLHLNFEGNRQLAKNIIETFGLFLYSSESNSCNGREAINHVIVRSTSSVSNICPIDNPSNADENSVPDGNICSSRWRKGVTIVSLNVNSLTTGMMWSGKECTCRICR